MEIAEFLKTVITAPEPGFFCLAAGPPSGGWIERWFRWPQQLDEIVAEVAKLRGNHNVYFSSYLFRTPNSTATNVLPTRTIQADLDDANTDDLPLEPTVLVRTSPNRHQAFWVLKDGPLDLEVHRILSRKLTYAIPKCDHSGWALGRKVRVPDSFNFKYLDGPKPVEVINVSERRYSASDFELLPDTVASVAASLGPEGEVETFIDEAHSITSAIGPQELLESIKDKIPPKVYVQYNSVAQDRSTALWSLTLNAFKAGLDRREVFWLAKHSANNKFADLRRGGERELAKDVLRAETVVRSSGADPKEVITSAKRAQAPAVIRKANILNLTLDFMKQRGSFLHTTNDALWYVRRDLGRPITISMRSDYLDALLDLEYGLNQTEAEQTYTVAGICAHTRNLTPQAVQLALSYYDTEFNTLLLHSGRKDVFKISKSGVETVVDGSHNVVFPWQIWVEPFALSAYADSNWAENLFGHSAGDDALANLIGIDRAAALALLRVWFLFLLFRNTAVSRPILATFGQPGSGKSTLFRKVYALLYGRQKSVGSVTNMDDFDHAVSSDPFLVLDNVDTWERWLPDRLALSASTSDIQRRKLYTDSDQIVLKRQALIGITAHNPRFGREDVADRLLLLTFERLEKFIPEQLIIDEIIANRGRLWAGIVQDVQRILQTEAPKAGPQFRVEDFARIGMWFAKALDIESEFVSALTSIRYGQRSFSLEEDVILVSALRAVINEAEGNEITDLTPTQIWSRLELRTPDPQAFIKTYRNSASLAKKLLSLQDALKLIFDITWRMDSELGTRVWSIRKKSTNGTNHYYGLERESATARA